jgi:hypothetical protein
MSGVVYLEILLSISDVTGFKSAVLMASTILLLHVVL